MASRLTTSNSNEGQQDLASFLASTIVTIGAVQGRLHEEHERLVSGQRQLSQDRARLNDERIVCETARTEHRLLEEQLREANDAADTLAAEVDTERKSHRSTQQQLADCRLAFEAAEEGRRNAVDAATKKRSSRPPGRAPEGLNQTLRKKQACGAASAEIVASSKQQQQQQQHALPTCLLGTPFRENISNIQSGLRTMSQVSPAEGRDVDADTESFSDKNKAQEEAEQKQKEYMYRTDNHEEERRESVADSSSSDGDEGQPQPPRRTTRRGRKPEMWQDDPSSVGTFSEDVHRCLTL